jgi:hypothetical protein
MFANIISNTNLQKSKLWSANYFINSSAKDISTPYAMVCLADLVTEQKTTMNPQQHTNDIFSYIGLENIQSNTRVLVNLKECRGKEIKSNAKIFLTGDILYGRLRPALNKVLLVDVPIRNGICSTEILVLRPNLKKVNPDFLAELLLSDLILEKAVNLVRGASLPRIQSSDLLALQIPLPPKDEQDELAIFIQQHRKSWFQIRKLAEEIPKHIASQTMNFLLYSQKPKNHSLDFLEHP